jgi:hypothetical protein
MIKINTKKFSFMIAIENLKTFLFFSFKIDQLSKISSLFFFFCVCQKLFYHAFFEMPTCFYLLSAGALKPNFRFFDPQKCIFFLHDMSHDHIDFGPQNPFLGSQSAIWIFGSFFTSTWNIDQFWCLKCDQESWEPKNVKSNNSCVTKILYLV